MAYNTLPCVGLNNAVACSTMLCVCLNNAVACSTLLCVRLNNAVACNTLQCVALNNAVASNTLMCVGLNKAVASDTLLKLQALVYDILPSTTAVFSYTIGSRKLSANEQFLIGAQTVLSLLQTTQIKQGVSFIAANKVYTSTNKTTIV